MDKYIQSYVKIPILVSILKSVVLSEHKEIGNVFVYWIQALFLNVTASNFLAAVSVLNVNPKNERENHLLLFTELLL